MKLLGYTLSGLGALLILISFGYDTAPDGTHNIGLLQQQMMLLTLACLMCLSGAIIYAIDKALERMEHAGLLPPAGVKPIASATEPSDNT